MTANVSQRGKTAFKRSIAWYLRQWSRILNVLTDEELERLIPLLSERSFRSRFQLFSTGEPPERVYLILKGRVKVYQVAENGKEVILDVVSRGGIVGDWAIVENGERTACAQAIDDTVAVTISWEDFTYFVQQSPRLGFAMVELMARRLAGMDYVDIQLSLDGADAATNDPIRGDGSHAAALALIAAPRKARVRVRTVLSDAAPGAVSLCARGVDETTYRVVDVAEVAGRVQ